MLNEINNYLPILNAILITDLFFIILNLNFFHIKSLKEWYLTFNLSAVIADVLIIFIGIIITSYIYNYFYKKFSLIKFIILALIIQIIHDIIFYIIIQATPIKKNKMMDLFKIYSNEISYFAIIGDSLMMIMSCILGYYLINLDQKTNINILIILLYLVPYFITIT